MSNLEVLFMFSLLGNIGLIMVTVISLQLYRHAREWRDKWRDAHVDALMAWDEVMDDKEVQE